jgi:hypothetical protein
MYSVELCFIIYLNLKYIDNCDNLFEIRLTLFKKHNLSKQKMELWDHPKFVYCKCQCTLICVHVHLF